MGPVKRYFRTMPARRKSSETKDSSANLGFEAKLWLAADKRQNRVRTTESGALMDGESTDTAKDALNLILT